MQDISINDNKTTNNEPFLRRAAAALAAAALASIACSGHAAARLSSSAGLPWTKAWLALATCAFVPALLFVVAVPRASAALSSFDPKNARARWTALFLFIAAMEGLLSTFGRVLRQSTHHHALAGTTFALGCLALALGVATVSARVAAFITRLGDNVARAGVVVSGLLAVGLLAMLARSLSDIARVTLLDGVAFVIAVALASRTSRPPRDKFEEEAHADDPNHEGLQLGVVAYIGAAIAIGVVVAGTFSLRTDASVVLPSVDALAPLYAQPASFFAGH